MRKKNKKEDWKMGKKKIKIRGEGGSKKKGENLGI